MCMSAIFIFIDGDWRTEVSIGEEFSVNLMQPNLTWPRLGQPSLIQPNPVT